VVELTPAVCFYRNIRFLRLEKKYSVRFMAQMIDMSPAHVYCLERGKRAPTLEVVVRFSRAFKVSISDLVDNLMKNA